MTIELAKIKIINVCLFFCSFSIIAQNNVTFWEKSDTLNTKRRNAVYITEAAAASVALIGLNQLWYADFKRSSFQTVNDNSEWLQMDKAGHVISSYYIGKIGMNMLDWAGESKKNQLLYGATLGFAFLGAVEVLDGFSEEWGFSVGDLAANAAGTGLLIGQELLWDEQRIQLKYSFHTTPYSSRRPDLLGENFLEQALKDYNGQTYWLSANLWSFNKKSKIPKWLNIAFGYGAEGMISANEDIFINPIFLPEQQRFRQYYLSLDVDLTKIKTRSKLLKTVFSAINFIKIPAPTFEITSKGDGKFHFIYF
ncbi:MAG: YfiM family protein [Flavobacteriaceae bacterium]|nr:YfiM family protein [Flavobacteriaceae bacterium]